MKLVLDDREVAWAAGIFEGEGCFSGNGKNIMISLAMCDKDVVDRFAAVVGLGKVSPKKMPLAKPHWKPQWQWYFNSYDQLEELALLIEPWLGERRLAKLEELREKRRVFLAQILRERPCKGCGEQFRPESPARSRNRLYCTAACRTKAGHERWRALCA